MKNNRKQLAAKILLLITLGVFHAVPAANAMPSQGTLNNTNAANIAVVDKQMNITGKGLNNIINWASFNIAKGETVKFNDKNNYLNLVHGVDMSRIYGTISGGNMVYLVNPNGILFAEGARLDNVGSFVASTRNISSINKEAFLNDPSDTNAVLGADNKIMDNKDYYPEDSSYVPKISVADIQLTNVPESATKIILDGPGGVILKNTEILDKTAQILTRKDSGEIGIGSDTGEVVLTDAQKQKIALIDGNIIYSFNNDNILEEYKLICDIEEMRSSQERVLLCKDVDMSNIENFSPIYRSYIIFNGMGYTVSNLKISSKKQHTGLFERVWGGEIRNLRLENVDIIGLEQEENGFHGIISNSFATGSIAGYFGGYIDNVNVTGTIKSNGMVGGLIGEATKTAVIRNSSNSADVIGNEAISLGGLVGNIFIGKEYESENSKSGLIANCFNYGSVKQTTDRSWIDSVLNSVGVGGIIGGIGMFDVTFSEGPHYSLIGVCNKGDITSDLNSKYGDTLIGGIIGSTEVYSSGGIGKNNIMIGEAYNFGSISGGDYNGGITTLPIYGSHEETKFLVMKSKVSGKNLDSFFIKENVKNDTSDFGTGLSVQELLDTYNKEMIGINNIDIIGEGISSDGIVPDIPKPDPDPVPNPDPSPDPDPKPDPDPVKPVVPSILEPNNKEYDGIISTVDQDYIDSLIDKNGDKIKIDSINDIHIKKVYEEVTSPKDFEITKKRIVDSLAEKLIEAKKAKENEDVAAKQQAYETLKSYITLSPNVNLDEKVYEAFLKPISEKIEASKVNEYDSKVSFNFVKEIGGALFDGLKHIPDQTVKVGNKVYSIHYDMDYTYQGLASVIATVTWKEGKTTKSTKMVLTNVNTKDGAKALTEYSYGLAKLNKDVWVNAATELISVGLKDIKGNGKTLVEAKKTKEFSEKLLNALSDDALAEAFAVDIGGATKDVVVNEGKNFLWNTASKRFEKLIEKQIPGGSDVIELAHGLQKLEKEFDAYNENMSTYQNDPNQVNKINAAYWGVSQMVNNMVSSL